MLARQVVLLTPSESMSPPQLLFYKPSVESTALCFHAFTHSFAGEKKLSHFPSTVCALFCTYEGVGVGASKTRPRLQRTSLSRLYAFESAGTQKRESPPVEGRRAVPAEAFS